MTWYASSGNTIVPPLPVLDMLVIDSLEILHEESMNTFLFFKLHVVNIWVDVLSWQTKKSAIAITRRLIDNSL